MYALIFGCGLTHKAVLDSFDFVEPLSVADRIMAKARNLAVARGERQSATKTTNKNPAQARLIGLDEAGRQKNGR